MEEVVWSLVSLTVAGVALATIALPTVVGTRRALRAIRRRSCRLGFWVFGRRTRSLHGTTPEETAIASRPAAAPAAAVAVAVPSQPSQAGQQAQEAQHAANVLAGLRSATPDVMTPLSNGAYRHELTAAPAEPTLTAPLPALTPLERAVWQAHERRGVPRAVENAWEEWSERGEGPHELVPGRYPLLGGLLTRQQIAEMAAAQGIAGWERTAVTGAGPMDPSSDGWN